MTMAMAMARTAEEPAELSLMKDEARMEYPLSLLKLASHLGILWHDISAPRALGRESSSPRASVIGDVLIWPAGPCSL